jgi:hypothetical protein
MTPSSNKQLTYQIYIHRYGTISFVECTPDFEFKDPYVVAAIVANSLRAGLYATVRSEDFPGLQPFSPNAVEAVYEFNYTVLDPLKKHVAYLLNHSLSGEPLTQSAAYRLLNLGVGTMYVPLENEQPVPEAVRPAAAVRNYRGGVIPTTPTPTKAADAVEQFIAAIPGVDTALHAAFPVDIVLEDETEDAPKWGPDVVASNAVADWILEQINLAVKNAVSTSHTDGPNVTLKISHSLGEDLKQMREDLMNSAIAKATPQIIDGVLQALSERSRREPCITNFDTRHQRKPVASENFDL